MKNESARYRRGVHRRRSIYKLSRTDLKRNDNAVNRKNARDWIKNTT